MKSLADYLKENFVCLNGCWQMQWKNIPSFKLLACSIGYSISGLAMFRGRKVYFHGNEHGFTVESA